MGDVYSISPIHAATAATTLSTIKIPLVGYSGYLALCDRRGAELAPATTMAINMLDEIVEELGLLSELFKVRGALAEAADEFGNVDPATAAALLAQFETAFGSLSTSVQDDVGTERVPFEPDEDWSQEQIAAWWDSLTATEQAQLIQLESERVGNTDGVPFADRIDANRISMQEVLDAGVDPRIEQFVDPTDPSRIDPDRAFIVFDPANDGFAAELFGDFATATSVAIVVPGMGSQLSNFGSVSGDARTLQNNDPSMAVIAWTGYDAPKGLSGDVVESAVGLYEVATEGLARTGGAQLTDFAGAVGLETGAPLTVIGHSYGSLTVGHAIQQGLTAERVVFIGSPGVGVDSVGEFPDGAVGEYFAGKVHGDPVADLQRFGDSPTDPDFGAHVYDAGEPNGFELQLHSEYYDDGTAVDNLRTIVQGGDPSDDRSPIINYITEPYSDLDLPLNPVDDIPTGIIDNIGAHAEEAILDGAGHVADGAEWAWETGGDVGEEILETFDPRRLDPRRVFGG